MSYPDAKRLVLSMLDFLSDEMNSEDTGQDAKESIEVTLQCLRMAYNLSEDDVTPPGQDKLINIFVNAVPKTPPKVLNEDEKSQAESLKQRGNEMMKAEKFEDAITFYSQAIDIDCNNAVYFCNRAAAYTGQNMYELAISDCKRSLEIDPKYSKALSRMGLTYSKMENYEKAVEYYKKALEIDPNNEGYKNNLKIAEDKLREYSAQMPNMGQMGGFPGMPDLGGLGNMMNNPMFMNMAQQVMENPAMRQMAANMFENFMGGAQAGGEEGSVGAAAPPSMDQFMQMGQAFAQNVSAENPELIEQLRNQMQGPDGANSNNKPENES